MHITGSKLELPTQTSNMSCLSIGNILPLHPVAHASRMYRKCLDGQAPTSMSIHATLVLPTMGRVIHILQSVDLCSFHE